MEDLVISLLDKILKEKSMDFLIQKIKINKSTNNYA